LQKIIIQNCGIEDSTVKRRFADHAVVLIHYAHQFANNHWEWDFRFGNWDLGQNEVENWDLDEN